MSRGVPLDDDGNVASIFLIACNIIVMNLDDFSILLRDFVSGIARSVNFLPRCNSLSGRKSLVSLINIKTRTLRGQLCRLVHTSDSRDALSVFYAAELPDVALQALRSFRACSFSDMYFSSASSGSPPNGRIIPHLERLFGVVDNFINYVNSYARFPMLNAEEFDALHIVHTTFLTDLSELVRQLQESVESCCIFVGNHEDDSVLAWLEHPACKRARTL